MMNESDIKTLVTFVVLGYNQETLLPHAVEGALSQTYTPLEIILSDDCSSDGSYEVFRDAMSNYQGPHKVILNRNDINLGMGGHLNRVMELARGELIVVAAGDDISLPDRVAKIEELYRESGRKAKSMFSNTVEIDESGNVLDVPVWVPDRRKIEHPSELVNADTILSGCAHAWSREVFEVFGPLLTPLICEDMVIPFRSSLLGEIIYTEDILVKHRRHLSNIWNYGRGEDIDRDIEHERFWTFEKKMIFNNWIADIGKMKDLVPERGQEWAHLEKTVRARLAFTEKEIALYSENLMNRVKGVISLALKDRSLRELRHRIGYFLLPRLYYGYLKAKYRR